MDRLAEKTHWYDVEYLALNARIRELEFDLLDVIRERDELKVALTIYEEVLEEG